MSHEKFMCNRVCSKTMACGHVCDKPCSVNHICSCDIDQAGEISDRAAIDEEQGTEPVDIQEMAEKEMRHEKMVNDYREFANGKAQEHDARLHAKAIAEDKGRRRKFVIRHSLVDLLDDDLSVNDSNPPVYVPSSASSDRLGDFGVPGVNQTVPQGNLLD